jgi:hypothetical protein
MVSEPVPSASVGEFTVVVPPLAEPMLMLVVDDAAPPVPKLIVLVVAAAVALVKRFAVSAVVGVPPRANVVAAPPMLRVVAVVLTKSNDVEPVTRDVVIDGEVARASTVPEPVVVISPTTPPLL